MSSDLPSDTLFCLGLINEPTSTGNLPLPGVTEESTKKVVEKLKVNYINNNAFFDGTIFHNHVMDHLLALWGMGGTAEALEEVYNTHDYQDQVKPSPEPITDSNFVQHLGQPEYYSAFITYFCKALSESSISEVLDRFLFSSAYNVNPNLSHDKTQLKPGERHPEMLARFVAGVLHPLIHVGYGVEFGIVQQVAEGLAQTAIHPDYQTPTTPLYLFTTPDPYGRGLSKLSLPASSAGLPPFLSFHHAVANDPRFSPAALHYARPDPVNPIPAGDVYFPALKIAGPHVIQLVNEWYDRWTVGVPEDKLEDRLEKMVEDVIVGNVFWYGVSGVAARGENVFTADFICMHFVTSSIFLPTLTLPHGRTKARTLYPPLSLSSRLQLVRTYLASCAIWYIASYRPSASKLSVHDFYAATDAKLASAPAPHAYKRGKAPHREFFKNTQKTVPVGTSVWFRIFQNAVVHPNEHLVKLVRALGAFDVWYGRRGAGSYGGVLEGAERLDGSMFLRTAILSLDRLGWAQEEEPQALWDRLGFYDGVVGDDIYKP